MRKFWQFRKQQDPWEKALAVKPNFKQAEPAPSPSPMALTQNPMSIGLVIGLPMAGRPIAPSWAVALATIQFPLNLAVGYNVVPGMEIDKARNYIVEQALERNAQYVFFLDDDVAPPSHVVQSLIYALDQDPSAVACGGIYCHKSANPTPLVYRGAGNGTFWDWEANEIFEVTGIGTGCLLIKTEIFKPNRGALTLDKPWFKTVDEPAKVEGANEGRRVISDDLYFCNQLNARGMKILAHGGVLCLHWDTNPMKCYMLPEDSKPLRKARARLIGVGPS